MACGVLLTRLIILFYRLNNSCRNPDLSSIIPSQPYRFQDKANEVVLDFEAFLLSNMGDRNTLWLHTQIKACMDAADCQPVSLSNLKLNNH